MTGHLSEVINTNLFNEYRSFSSHHGAQTSTETSAWHCSKCNMAGTALCDQNRRMCICRSGYKGSRCDRCVSIYDYVHENQCKRCPCDTQWSDGKCFFDSKLGVTRCTNCTDNAVGLLCDKCDHLNGFYYSEQSGKCEISETGTDTSKIASTLVYGSLGLGAILVALILLLSVLLICKKVRNRRNANRRRILVADRHQLIDALVADTSFSTPKPGTSANSEPTNGTYQRNHADNFFLAPGQHDCHSDNEDHEASPWAEDDYVVKQYYGADGVVRAQGAATARAGGWRLLGSGEDVGEPV